MENAARIILLLLSELRPAERLSVGASRLTTAAVLSAAAVIVLVAAFGCLVTAGWIVLIPIVGAAGAAACAAAGLAVVASVLWLLARTRFPREVPREAASPFADLHKGLQGLVGDDLMGEVHRLFGENKIPLLLAALVAGMTMGGRGASGRTRDPR